MAMSSCLSGKCDSSRRAINTLSIGDEVMHISPRKTRKKTKKSFKNSLTTSQISPKILIFSYRDNSLQFDMSKNLKKPRKRTNGYSSEPHPFNKPGQHPTQQMSLKLKYARDGTKMSSWPATLII